MVYIPYLIWFKIHNILKGFKINLGKPEWRISKDGRWKYQQPSGVWKYFIGTTCTGCGTLILQEDRHFKTGIPAFCGRGCIRGPLHHNFGRGQFEGGVKNVGGYRYIFIPEHPLADKKGGIYEHRMVWYDAYGEIPEGFIIHHKNGVKHDNRLNNFELIPAFTHKKKHREWLMEKRELLKTVRQLKAHIKKLENEYSEKISK